ncbi:UNVERIFIED_CONTAM: LOB domain-containing protein 25 [Sesamum latifolium]|uniref:LOB domain-containing protein 25 n=1 Tax=Sesamum latifolium TaxID=2727402 RepID=A0AAW2Y7G3_9LAMI
MPARLHFRPLLPTRRAHKIRQRPQNLRRQQRQQTPERDPPHQREDAVNSLAYEAEARLKDPVYGCVGAISVLQRQVLQLQKELDATNADLMRYTNLVMDTTHRRSFDGHNRVNMGYGGGSGSFDPNLGYPVPYYCPGWSNGPPGENPETGGDD